MRVADVRRTPGGARHIVVLADERGERHLPIWVGMPEAFAIAGRLEHVELPRPGTHDFAAALLQAAGSAVREVRITRLAESVFYADVVLADGTTVDARPSDAIALALTTGAPIAVEAAVLELAKEPMDADATDDSRVLAIETRDRLDAELRERASRS